MITTFLKRKKETFIQRDEAVFKKYTPCLCIFENSFVSLDVTSLPLLVKEECDVKIKTITFALRIVENKKTVFSSEQLA